MKQIRKILIANRGEIALRIIRTCKDMNIAAVAVYSDADCTSPHVLWADESVYIGTSASAESYLNIEAILKAARTAGVDAIHPGYGFLSENSRFATTCRDAGFLFIGPEPESIEVMGDKTRARQLMTRAGVPSPPGSSSDLQDVEEAKAVADKIGYPVLVKAAAGGGGKGMRVIDSPGQFEPEIKAARSEARNAFGDDRVYIEKYLKSPRHIEFQILADQYGNTVHLFERECSIQRRHQKIIEEAPCSIMTPELREDMAEAAIAAARSCNYTGAGTIEFLVDENKKFYFLEMNTRLQVEHPVTELIIGIDLVEMQIRIARGEKLPMKQQDLGIQGHAIECRIYAEDPGDNFLPSTGTLLRHRIPSGPGIRVDAGVEEGNEITIHYDPMISKLCVHSKDRKGSIERMKRALNEYEISGCKTTIPFCQFTMNHEGFVIGEYNTNFVMDEFNMESDQNGIYTETDDVAPIVSALLMAEIPKTEQKGSPADPGSNSVHFGESNWWSKRRKFKL